MRSHPERPQIPKRRGREMLVAAHLSGEYFYRSRMTPGDRVALDWLLMKHYASDRMVLYNATTPSAYVTRRGRKLAHKLARNA